MAASLVVLVALTMFGAYGWQPAAVEGYRSPYESSYLDTSLARFHYSKTGSGSPVVLVAGGAAGSTRRATGRRRGAVTGLREGVTGARGLTCRDAAEDTRGAIRTWCVLRGQRYADA